MYVHHTVQMHRLGVRRRLLPALTYCRSQLQLGKELSNQNGAKGIGKADIKNKA